MAATHSLRSLHSISRHHATKWFHCHQRSFSLFGPSEQDWKKWAKEFGIEELDEEDGDRDPREVTCQELRDSLKLQGKFVIDKSTIPQLELPDDSWFSDSHIYVQQTNLDDVWRMGYSPIRFSSTRHVEWLVFDSEPNDIKLYSEALMWYSICDWKPVRMVGQSINDIQFTMCSPFHRIQIISINEKIQNDPPLIIDREVEPNWRWIITFRWINRKEEIFAKPPIDNGRYGRWFDTEQYIEWLKDEGLYKQWQIDTVNKMAEDKYLKLLTTEETSASEDRHRQRMEEALKTKDTRPRYMKLDDDYRGVYRDEDEPQKQSGSWKPKWFPF